MDSMKPSFSVGKRSAMLLALTLILLSSSNTFVSTVYKQSLASDIALRDIAPPMLTSPSLAGIDKGPSVVSELITLRVVGLNRGGELKVFDDGLVQASAWGNMPAIRTGQSNMVASYHLPPEKLDYLISRFKEVRFMELNSAYTAQDSPGRIVDYDRATVTFNLEGQTNSVYTRGPSPISGLIRDLYDIWAESGL
jgi:hypothetical protein